MDNATLDPAPTQVTPANGPTVVELDQLDAALSEFGEAADYSARLYRLKGGKPEYLYTYALADFSLARVQAGYGAGDFRAQVCKPGGKIVRTLTFSVGEQPRDIGSPAAARAPTPETAPQLPGNDLIRLMMHNNEQNTKLFVAMIEANKRPESSGGLSSLKDIVPLLQLLKPDKTSLSDLLDTMLKLQDAMPAAAGGGDGSEITEIARAATALAPLLNRFGGAQPAAPRPSPSQPALPPATSPRPTRRDVVATIGPTTHAPVAVTKELRGGIAEDVIDPRSDPTPAAPADIDPGTGLPVAPEPFATVLRIIREHMAARRTPAETAEALGEFFNTYDDEYDNDTTPPDQFRSLWEVLDKTKPGTLTEQVVPFLGMAAEPYLAWIANVESTLREISADTAGDDDAPPATLSEALNRELDNDPQTGGPGAPVDDDGMPRAGNPASKPHPAPAIPQATAPATAPATPAPADNKGTSNGKTDPVSAGGGPRGGRSRRPRKD